MTDRADDAPTKLLGFAKQHAGARSLVDELLAERRPTATVTSRGRITIPAEVRARMGLIPGSRVVFVEGPNGSYEIRPEGRSDS